MKFPIIKCRCCTPKTHSCTPQTHRRTHTDISCHLNLVNFRTSTSIIPTKMLNAPLFLCLILVWLIYTPGEQGEPSICPLLKHIFPLFLSVSQMFSVMDLSDGEWRHAYQCVVLDKRGRFVTVVVGQSWVCACACLCLTLTSSPSS